MCSLLLLSLFFSSLIFSFLLSLHSVEIDGESAEKGQAELKEKLKTVVESLDTRASSKEQDADTKLKITKV